ncbi:MAG: class I SAM-dependent methyltransferase, partial [Candidatus Poribacteria bacterium]
MSRQFTDGWEIAYQQANTQEQSLWKERPIEFLPEKIPSLQEFGVKSILDAGCGDGRNLLYLAQQAFLCTGLDISPSALDKATHRLRE